MSGHYPRNRSNPPASRRRAARPPAGRHGGERLHRVFGLATTVMAKRRSTGGPRGGDCTLSNKHHPIFHERFPMSATNQNPFRKSTRKPFSAYQAQVLVFAKLGCSRRLAAEKAGCCHTTIGRAARRDPAFAAQLEEAENHVDIASLTRINEAAAENKNWRAAAWILERRHPEEFGHRTPHSFSADQVMAVLAEVFSFTMPIVAPKEAGDFLRAFNRVMGRMEGNAKNADRWRNFAAGGLNRGRDGKKPLRSPYEHPQWCDPDRPMTVKEVSNEAVAWIHTLSQDDKELLHEIWDRRQAAKKKQPKESVKDELIRLLAEEKATAAGASGRTGSRSGSRSGLRAAGRRRNG